MRSRTALKQMRTKHEAILYISIDVGDRHWELGLTDGSGTIKTKKMQAGEFTEFDQCIEWAEDYFELPDAYGVACCYEAGREGFWIQRKLRLMGYDCGVIDPGSLREQKKGERAKTDRIDAEKLGAELVRWCEGHRDHTFHLVRIPGPEDEDDRHLFREHEQLLAEKNAHENRIEGLLKNQGIEEYPAPGDEAFDDWLQQAVTGDDRSLGRGLRRRLSREVDRLRAVHEDLKEVERERGAYLRGEGREEIIEKCRMLVSLKGIGEKTAHALVAEMYGWRNFQNRREVGAFVGLDPKRYDSGTSEPDRPISKQGDSRIRRIMIQLARNWLCWQPTSELSEWARGRFQTERETVSNRGIVALARKLLNRLRVYLEDGVVPRGAVFMAPEF